jgi:hypothetical protein
MVSIVFRTPCTFHTDCDETAVALLHGRSAKDGPITGEEWKKVCWVCEGITGAIRATMLKTGEWKCPACGFKHTVDLANKGPVTPSLSMWYRAIEGTPKE